MKKTKLLFYIITMFYNFCFGQKILIGQVFSEFNEPLKYVNIGILGKDVGAVSDSIGNFRIVIEEKYKNDSLTFSSPGHKSLKLEIEQIPHLKNEKYILDVKSKDIEEVFITANKTKEIKLGTTAFTTMVAGYIYVNNDKNKDIQEFAKEIKINKKSKVKDINIHLFNVINFNKYSFRINIYDIKNGLPNNKLNNYNIIIDKELKNGWNTFNVETYNLIYSDPIFVSIEYIPNSVNEGEPFRYSGKFFGRSIKRNASLGNWAITKGISSSIYVTVIQ